MTTQKIQQSAQAYAVVDHAHLSKSEDTEYFIHPISGEITASTCNMAKLVDLQ